MQERFATGAALVGALALLGRPDLVAALAAQLDDGADGAQDQDAHADAAAVGWPGGWTPPQSSRLVPFATVDEPQTPAYVVTLRHLADARTATFAVHRVIWHDLEGDDPTVSDLVLAFESDAGAMLRAIDPEALRLRLFFGAGPSYDEVATADASLFDVEVNPLEGRIYLKLRRPPAWAATELPPDELWRHLRSCVLITEPE